VKTSQFSFDLPDELIAQTPSATRDGSRLLVLNRNTGEITHSSVKELPRWIEPGTLVVLNDTRVRKARLFATQTATARAAGAPPRGTVTEIVLLEEKGSGRWEAITGRAGRLKPGAVLNLPDGVTATLEASAAESPDSGTRILRFDPAIDEAWLERNGHVPLPPYIKRSDLPSDEERYQTIYARAVGSAAAPTAGLHFTPALLEELRIAGADLAWVTLHIGLGTFKPIRTENVEDHRMHEEAFAVPARTKALVDSAVGEGRHVLAIGTTVVRTLESAWGPPGLREGEGRTSMFITPGYSFKVVNRMFTNFHTPGSSLLVLVSAFAGTGRILQTYAEAVRRGYRFFSYGDAMLIV
jgi:S-adenosylmethionine:tRNA ribosyltransferase-isomerase